MCGVGRGCSAGSGRWQLEGGALAQVLAVCAQPGVGRGAADVVQLGQKGPVGLRLAGGAELRELDFGVEPVQAQVVHALEQRAPVGAVGAAGFLQQFASMPPGTLEQVESLEQLRVLEAGYPIAVAISPEPFPPGIDTPEDLQRAETLLQAMAAR